MNLRSPFIIFLLGSTFFTTSVFAASENLDELAARKSRLATASWGKVYLEDQATLVWQPETLCYTDVTTGVEVWRLTSTNGNRNSLPDIAWSHFSADGKRFSFGSHRDTSANSSAYETNVAYEGAVMMMRTDGSYLRPANNAPFEVYVHSRFLHWSPTEPDVYYGFGRNYASEGLNNDDLYRVNVGDTSIDKSLVLATGVGAEVSIDRAISPDSTKLFAMSGGNAYPISLHGANAATLDAGRGWAAHRQLDDYWGGTPAGTSYAFHSAPNLVGVGDKQWFYFIPEGYTAWWRIKLSGSAADGGPLHVSDNTDPFQFGGEVEPVMNFGNNIGTCDSVATSPWLCDSDPTTGGDRDVSHNAYDRWGKYVAGGPSGNGPYYAVWDLDAHNFYRNAITAPRWGHHYDWDAWSDYFAASPSGVGATNFIYSIKYNGTDTRKIADVHYREAGSTDYNSNPRVTQSPDGTKLVYHSDFLYNVANNWDLFYAVAYYPHPPEIISVSNGVVRFDWRTDQATSRGYTQRGWPNEATDDPPPPRETSKFRLWKSANGSTGWTPVGTVDANIFNRYNFATGTWSGLKYWEITDPVPGGYYAVTAVEWSGLESRTLSNVYSAAGTQVKEYPTNPKVKEEFYKQLPTAPNFIVYKQTTAGHYRLEWEEISDQMVRYYNIYYSTSQSPAITQQNRIASIPKGGTHFIDWLADKNLEAHYIVTSVDSQGNESSVVSPKILNITNIQK